METSGWRTGRQTQTKPSVWARPSQRYVNVTTSLKPQARDAAENDRSFWVVDRGTDPDNAIRLGFPGRVDPRTLAGTVLGSPVVPVATVAHMRAPPPVDPDDYRAVRYAVEADAAAEAALCYDVLTGLHGAY